jgi:ribosome-binding factor A
MLPYKRSKRVADQIRREVSEILMRRLKDPRLGFLTVVDVKLSDDLRLARVYVSVMRPEERAESMQALKEAQGFVRTELARRLRIKVIPQVEFLLDTTMEQASRIEELLRKLREQR